MRWCWQWEIFVVHVHGNEVGRVWLRRTHIAAMHGGNEDHATRVSPLTDEEPLIGVESGIDIVWEVVGKDRGYGRNSMIGEGETPLCCSGSGSVHERAFGTENRDVSCYGGISGHWGSEILTSRGGDENVIGVYSDILMEWGEEEGVEDFLSDLGRSGRHR